MAAIYSKETTKHPKHNRDQEHIKYVVLVGIAVCFHAKQEIKCLRES